MDSRAVGIGDDIVVLCKHVPVDLGNHQFLAGIHPPERGIVHHPAAHLREEGRKLVRGLSPGAEKCQLRLGRDGILRAHHRPLTALETNLAAHRLLGRHRQQFIHREIPFLQHLEHSGTHQSGSTHKSDFHINRVFRKYSAFALKVVYYSRSRRMEISKPGRALDYS